MSLFKPANGGGGLTTEQLNALFSDSDSAAFLSEIEAKLAPSGEIRAFKKSRVPAAYTIAADPAPSYNYAGLTNGTCIFNDAFRIPAGLPSSYAVPFRQANGDLVVYYIPVPTASPQSIAKHNISTGEVTQLPAQVPGNSGSQWGTAYALNPVDGKAYFHANTNSAGNFFRFDPATETTEILATSSITTGTSVAIEHDSAGNVYVILLTNSSAFQRWNYADGLWTVLQSLPIVSNSAGRITAIADKVIFQQTATTTYYTYDSVTNTFDAGKVYATTVPESRYVSYPVGAGTIVTPVAAGANHSRWTLDAGGNLVIEALLNTAIPGPTFTPGAVPFDAADPVTGVIPGFMQVATSATAGVASLRHMSELALGDPVVLAIKN